MDEYGAVDEATELEDEMLAAMAGAIAALLEGDAPEWHEVNASASSLRSELNAIANRHERPMQDAARGDVEHESEANVEALRAVAGADASPNAMTAAKAAQEAADDVSKVPQTMASDAHRRYLQEAYRAALETRAGAYRPDAVADAVRRLGERGISCSTYTDRSGRLYRVPVDVGVRRMIETRAMQMMSDQTLEVARATGQDLVEVSSHIGARPSHAEWQGRVYSLSGTSERYPKFETACNVGDMVTGIYGWNCRHHIAIYIEGTRRRWSEDPAKDAGTTNEEAYAARSKQRRYENQIRKLKRASRALKSQGLDSREVDYKVSALERALAKHVKAHPYLRRERWREGPVLGDRAKRRTSTGRYAYSQKELDEVIEKYAPNINWIVRPKYNPRLRSYGKTYAEQVFPGYNRVTGIDIGPQKNDDVLELVDTILHEAMEAKMLKRVDPRLEGGDKAVHPHIQKVIDKYMKMKGFK